MKLPRFLRKDNPAYRSILVSYGGMSGPAWKTVDEASYIREGYIQCAPVHACVSMTAKAGSSVRWFLTRNDKELDEHPLLTKLARPNKYESGQRFHESVFTFLRVTGNAYVYRNSGIPSMPPLNLYWFRSDRMTVLKSKDWKNPVAGYEYSAGTKPEQLDERLVLHLKEPHPSDDWYGLSRVQVAAREIDTWNESVNWNMKLLQNDMRIPGLVTGKAIAGDIQKLRTMWRERYQGPDNAGVPLFLDGEDIKWEPITGTAKDSDWSEGQRRVLRSICSVFGVPSQLLGDTEATTYANYQEARKAFYLETVLPLLDFYRDELNAWLVPLYGDGLYLDYDRDKIEALQEDRGQKYAYLEGARFLSINEKRDAVGYDEITEGDVLLVPFSDQPLGSEGGKPVAGGDDEDEDGEKQRGGVRLIKAVKKSYWTEPERKEKLWKAFDGRVTVRQRAFASLATNYLERQWKSVKAAISKHSMLNGVTASSVFDLKAETERYKDIFYGWYLDNFIRGGNAGMQSSKGELFDDAEFKADKPSSWVFHMTEAQRLKLIEMIYKSGTKVNETTLEAVEKAIYKAQAENLTVEEFTQEIWKQVADFDPWRARLWARTESAKVDNFGQTEGYRETEFVERKGWMCSFVPESREEHIAADGQEVALDADFTVGGESLAYPGDPRGSAGTVVNCLCSTYPVL